MNHQSSISVSARCAVIAAFLIAACSNAPTADLDDTFTVRIGKRVSVEDADLAITFVRVVEDSRCPATADCIWAGNAQIELEIRNGGALTTAMLNTFQGAREVAVGSYRISLEALLPTPAGTGPTDPDDYRATLLARRTGVVCTEEARPALMVSLTDSVTGVTNFTNVLVAAQSGIYADTARAAVLPDQFMSSLSLAYEHPGTYTVTVRADGYQPWTKSGVVVTADQCHVVTTPLTARMVK